MNIIQSINDKNLFRPFLADSNGKLTTWMHWLTAIRVLYGLPIRGTRNRELVQQCMGRTPPSTAFSTALFLTGRRSGKSRIAAVVAAYEAVLAGHESKLSKGERGIVLICAPTRAQSRVVHDYVRGIFETPILANEIAREDRQTFELKNGTRIEILAGDWRIVRGYTLLAAIIDEAAFFGYDSESKVRSDTELIRAIQPSLATVGGKLIAISTPYAMKGWCYKQWKRNFGNDAGKTLVWNCGSRVMNPTLSKAIVDEALADDLAAAKAEYLGEFRDDVSTFLPRDVIESLVVRGRKQLLCDSRRRYAAFCDISGGRVDDAALAIAHLSDGKVILDFIRRWRPPFSPDRVVGEMVEDLQQYRIDRCLGDNYSAEFVKQSFESRGIRYSRASTNPWSKSPTAKIAKPKSQLYLELLPRLCSGEIELLDNEILITQLAGLERRTRSGGRDSIDHGPGQHDDLANCAAGVSVAATQRRVVLRSMVSGPAPDDSSAFSRALNGFRSERELYRHEQEMCREPEDDQEPIREIMRKCGRY